MLDISGNEHVKGNIVYIHQYITSIGVYLKLIAEVD
jgi:hypothetical protein